MPTIFGGLRRGVGRVTTGYPPPTPVKKKERRVDFNNYTDDNKNNNIFCHYLQLLLPGASGKLK